MQSNKIICFFGLLQIMLWSNIAVANNKLDIQFIENKGQVIDMNRNPRPDILYSGNSKGVKIYLREYGVSYVLNQIPGLEELMDKEAQMKKDGMDENEIEQAIENLRKELLLNIHRVDVDFIGCNKNISTLTEEEIGGYSNYYLSQCPDGITNVKSFGKITRQNIYDHIDVAFYGGETGGLEYDFIINPGGNPDEISLQYSGADQLSITSDGKLIIKTSLGEIKEWMPLTYQNTARGIVERKARYELFEDNIVKIQIGNYNPSQPLIIDPWCTWITYLGGTDQDKGYSVVTDVYGNIITVGETASSVGFPISVGAQQVAYGGSTFDGYIAKFDELGNRLWATYYGGNAGDVAIDVAMYGLSDIIVSGSTGSGDFPTTPGVFKTVYAGSGIVEGFILRFDGAGIRIWASLYGGNDQDRGLGITSDSKGMIYMGGESKSDNLPTTSSSFQDTLYNTGYDAYLTKFDSVGNHIWSTYIGGEWSDRFYDIIVDREDNIIGVGSTGSEYFPIGVGTFQDTVASTGATVDGCIVKFDSTGSLLWGTYYGSVALDYFGNVAIDNDNNIYATGGSTSPDFPVSSGAFQNTKNIGWDGVFVKFNKSGTRLWATFFGGDGEDRVNGIDIDETENLICLSGYTESTDLPVSTDAGQLAYNPGGAFPRDNYYASFDTAGNKECVTYIGGGERDDQEITGGNSIATFGEYVYITGNVRTGFYPVTSDAFQTVYGGGFNDAFISQLPKNCTFIPITLDLGEDTSICIGDSIILDAENPGFNYLWQDSSIAQTFISVDSGMYFVTVSKSDSCYVRDTVEVNIFPLPVVNAGTDDTIYSGEDIQLNGNGGTSYSWSPTDGLDDPSIQNPTASPGQTTVYYVTVTDSNGCQSFDSIIIYVVESKVVFWIPNSFSPNGDGINDVFSVKLISYEVESFTFRINNRSGEKIFESTDTNIGWDGTYDGVIQPSETYIYMVSFIDKITGEEVTWKGNVTLTI